MLQDRVVGFGGEVEMTTNKRDAGKLQLVRVPDITCFGRAIAIDG
jgi:hypothetical protein